MRFDKLSNQAETKAKRLCGDAGETARPCADLHIFCLNTPLGVVPIRAVKSCSMMKPNVVPEAGHRQPILLGFC